MHANWRLFFSLAVILFQLKEVYLTRIFTNKLQINRQLQQQTVQGASYVATIDVTFPNCIGSCDNGVGLTVQKWVQSSLTQVDNAIQMQNSNSPCQTDGCIANTKFNKPGWGYNVQFIGNKDSGSGQLYKQQLSNTKQDLVDQLKTSSALSSVQAQLSVDISDVKQGTVDSQPIISGLSRKSSMVVIIVICVVGFLLIAGAVGCGLCCCFCRKNRRRNKDFKEIPKNMPQQTNTFFHKQLNKMDDRQNSNTYNNESPQILASQNTNISRDNSMASDRSMSPAQFSLLKNDKEVDLSDPPGVTGAKTPKQKINSIKENSNPNIMHFQQYGLEQQLMGSQRKDQEAPPHAYNNVTSQSRQTSNMSSASGQTTLGSIQNMLRDNFKDTIGFMTASTMDREKRNNQLKLEKYINKIYMESGGEFLEQYQLEGEGHTKEGGSSKVYFAKVIGTEQEVAIKFFLQEEAFDREFHIYIEHPNLVGTATPTVKEVGEGGNYIGQDGKRKWQPSYIVMDKGMDLNDYMQSRNLTRSLATRTLYQMVKCICNLHEANIAHNDLKPGNILWVPQLQAWRLIDYSVAAEFNEKRPIELTLEYCAPEVLEAHEKRKGEIISGPEVDIWQLGLLILEIYTGRSQIGFAQNEQQARSMILGKLPLPHEQDPAILDQIPDRLASIVLKMLNRSKQFRPTIQEIKDVVKGMMENQEQMSLQRVVGIYSVVDIENAFRDVNYGSKQPGPAVAINVVLDEISMSKGKTPMMASCPIIKGSVLDENDVIYQLRAGFKYRLHLYIQHVDDTRTYDLPIVGVTSIKVTPKDGKEVEQYPFVMHHSDVLWHGYVDWDPSQHGSEQLSVLTKVQKRLGGRVENHLDVKLQVPSGQDVLVSKPLFVAINSQTSNLDGLRNREAWTQGGTVDAFKEGGVILANIDKSRDHDFQDYQSILSE